MDSAMNNNNNCRTETSAKDAELFIHSYIYKSMANIEASVNDALIAC